MKTTQVRTIRYFLWEKQMNGQKYVMIQANIIRSRIKITSEGNKVAPYYDELQMTKEQVDEALAKNRMAFGSLDREEMHQNSKYVFYVPSKR